MIEQPNIVNFHGKWIPMSSLFIDAEEGSTYKKSTVITMREQYGGGFDATEKDIVLTFRGEARIREHPDEHPVKLNLETLLLWWNKVHSFSLQMRSKPTYSGAKRFTELILKRYMMPLGKVTPNIQFLESHFGKAKDMIMTERPTVLMDYPVFLSAPPAYQTLHNSQNAISGHDWGEMMINLGRTKLDVTVGVEDARFRPQIGIVIDKQTRSFGIKWQEILDLDVRQPAGQVDINYLSGSAGLVGPRLPATSGQSIPIFGFPLDGGVIIDGLLTINGYFSEFTVDSEEPEAGFVNVSFPKATKYIDYLEYLEEIWAGPIKGKKIAGSFNLKNERWHGLIEFSQKPIKNSWRGPVQFSKKDKEDWFLSDQHLLLKP